MIKYLLKDTWDAISSGRRFGPVGDLRQLVFPILVFAVAATVIAWKVMIPFWIFTALVIGYLRYSRGKDSL